MAEPSSLHRALGLLAEVFRPLVEATDPSRAASLLQDLGVFATPAQSSGLVSALQAAGAAAEALADDVAALAQALETDDTGTAAARSLAAVERIGTLVAAIASLPAAVAGLGLPAALQANFADRLFDHLLQRALATVGAAEILALLGVLRRQEVNFDLGDPQVPPHVVSSFDFGRLGDWLGDPVGAAAAEYGWGTGGVDFDALIRRLATLLVRFLPQALVDPDPPQPILDTGIFELRPRTDLVPPGLELELRQTVAAGPIQLGGTDFTATLDPKVALPFGLAVTLRPPFQLEASVQGGALPSGEVTLQLAVDRTGAAEPVVVFGDAEASRLAFRRLAVEGSARFTGSDVLPGFRAEITGGEIVIGTDDADGFIAKLLDGVRLESSFDLGIGVSVDQGVYFEGSSTLEVQLPIHLSLGPVDVDAMTISLGIEGARFPLSLGANIKAEIGPLIAVVEDLGLTATFALRDDRGGNAGPLDITVAFKPPTGVGLSIDAGVVRGGGFPQHRHPARRVCRAAATQHPRDRHRHRDRNHLHQAARRLGAGSRSSRSSRSSSIQGFSSASASRCSASAASSASTARWMSRRCRRARGPVRSTACCSPRTSSPTPRRSSRTSAPSSRPRRAPSSSAR